MFFLSLWPNMKTGRRILKLTARAATHRHEADELVRSAPYAETCFLSSETLLHNYCIIWPVLNIKSYEHIVTQQLGAYLGDILIFAVATLLQPLRSLRMRQRQACRTRRSFHFVRSHSVPSAIGPFGGAASFQLQLHIGIASKVCGHTHIVEAIIIQ